MQPVVHHVSVILLGMAGLIGIAACFLVARQSPRYQGPWAAPADPLEVPRAIRKIEEGLKASPFWNAPPVFLRDKSSFFEKGEEAALLSRKLGWRLGRIIALNCSRATLLVPNRRGEPVISEYNTQRLFRVARA